MGRIHLMHQKHPEVWYLLEEGVDYIGAKSNGLAVQLGSEDILQADSIAELLHKLQESKDPRWFVVLDFIDSKKRTRFEMYPHHYEIHILIGFVPEVCECRTNENCYLADWQVGYPAELWVKTDDAHLQRVRGFTEKAQAKAHEYIRENGLEYEKEAE